MPHFVHSVCSQHLHSVKFTGPLLTAAGGLWRGSVRWGWIDGERRWNVPWNTCLHLQCRESERGGGRTRERPHGPPRSWIIDEVGGMEAFHRRSPILPPQSTHTHTHTHTKSHPNNIPRTHQISRRQRAFTLQFQPCTSQYPCTPKTLVLSRHTHSFTLTHTHTFWGPHHACIIETHLARWLSPDIWLTKPVTLKPRE